MLQGANTKDAYVFYFNFSTDIIAGDGGALG